MKTKEDRTAKQTAREAGEALLPTGLYYSNTMLVNVTADAVSGVKA
jgi:hypothetical protein